MTPKEVVPPAGRPGARVPQRRRHHAEEPVEDPVRAERREALELAAERARGKARPAAPIPFVGAALRKDPLASVEYEVVPLPAASPLFGSSLNGRNFDGND